MSFVKEIILVHFNIDCFLPISNGTFLGSAGKFFD